MTDYKFLKSFTLPNGMTIKNRIVIPPLTELMSYANGVISDDELAYYDQRAGGVGMFITAAAQTSPRERGGKNYEGELGAHEDRFIPGLHQLATTIQQEGTRAVLQLLNPGRMNNSQLLGGAQPVSASAIAAPREGMETPRALTEDEILAVIDDFGQATRRAIQAGFDGIEIHGANTYLIQQFFSPNSNQRQDKWGGSLENRMRFPLAIVDKCAEVIKQYADKPFILGYRISPEEVETPGIRLADTMKLIDQLITKPIDYLHVSMGYVFRTSLNDQDDQEPLIDKIKREVNGKVPLISVGSVATPQQAEDVMDDGVEFVALGRELIREPQWVQKVENGHEDTIRYTTPIEDLPERHIGLPLWDFITKELGMPMNIDPENGKELNSNTQPINGLW
ncbi:NADH-dependent flavin oxidoreductase [Levilactobacillus angrenensis]|uniref:NADH-dependent flavin oxidoreductase n=1 Tax=Levilactobacillus angrenensis TaxID=2486020 RepID=A0ABW1UBN0_9LACO|nr:NADH-dependent flavin oxidoreductase [Levilactobacillus angrenensis]